MSKDAKPANKGGMYGLLDSDQVASILIAPFAGDRGEYPVASLWKDGEWTIVYSRKLVTSSKTDVQFNKLDATNYFGLALFDNAQVRHAFTNGALKLVFAK